MAVTFRDFPVEVYNFLLKFQSNRKILSNFVILYFLVDFLSKIDLKVARFCDTL